MVGSTISNRQTGRRNNNFNIFKSIFFEQIYFCDNSEGSYNFIGNVLKEFLCVFYSDNVFRIINTYIEFAALRIGKAADPLEIIIAPSFLELYILALFHNTPSTRYNL